MSTAPRSAPLGVWSAPGRVNLIGEHTDYNDGFVLPFAIDRRTTVALTLRDDGILRVSSSFTGSSRSQVAEVALSALDAEVEAGRVTGWSAYPIGVAWALGQRGADLAVVPGVELAIDSDVPVGAGLSSSAAIECAVAVALNEVWNLGLDRETLVQVGQHAENVVVGAPTGIMDQSASLLGQQGTAVFLDCRTLETRNVPLDLEPNGLVVLVIDTGVHHSHATGGYRERRASCDAGAAALGVASLRDVTVDDLDRAQALVDSGLLDEVTFRRVRHVVTENDRVLQTVATLEREGPRAIGPLLDASHVSMRDDFEISVPELDVAVEAAQRSGALGARMTGGGFGGAAIALVPVEHLERVTSAVNAAFADRGFTAPTLFTVTPSAGARREPAPSEEDDS